MIVIYLIDSSKSDDNDEEDDDEEDEGSNKNNLLDSSVPLPNDDQAVVRISNFFLTAFYILCMF